MTVCRRPVASDVPRGAGNRGLLGVGAHRNPVKVPPPTPNRCSTKALKFEDAPIGAPSEASPLTACVQAVPGIRSLMTRMPMSRGMVKAALRQFWLGRAID